MAVADGARVESGLLTATLSAAVPLWIDQADGWGEEHRADLLNRWAVEAAEVIPYRADIMLFSGGKKGEAAEVFNHLARAIAVLAHNPGGVKVFSLLWCVRHSPAGAETTGAVCQDCLAEDQDAT